MCDCVNPVLATLVDLICPHADQSWSHERTQKKNDDWAVAPPVGQPMPHPCSTAPARLNYRKHFNQYLELHKQNPLETTFRRPVADLHSGLPFPTFPYNKDQPLLPHPADSSPGGYSNLSGAPPLPPIQQDCDPDIEEGLSVPQPPHPLPHPLPHPHHGDARPGAATAAAAPPRQSPVHQAPEQAAPSPPPPDVPAQAQAPDPPAPLQHRASQPQFWGQPLVTRNMAQPDTQPPHATPLAPPLEPRHVEINFFELRMGQVIGEGGFGKVYYGEWRGVPVAVKVMGTDGSARAGVVREFCREVHTMTLLPPHPNILRLLAASTRPPNLALVTEYCSQGSLYALLHSPAVYLSWGQVVAICLAAARGMAHLHAHHVLHRDLKSGNLLVTASFAIKVADFGLSRVYQDLNTMTGGLGTYQWMAPEVLANQRYSEKADVYSFGVVAWECCARQVPYAGLNGMQAAMAVMNKGLRPEVPRHTPEPLAALIRRCWAAVPEQRPLFPEIVDALCAMQQQIMQAA